MTHGPQRIRDLLGEAGAEPSRALGQNFVADPNTVRRIVALAGVEARDPVVEVGAGLGSLTLALAEVGARVVALEIDRQLVEVLNRVVGETSTAGEVTVHHMDALEADWVTLLGGHDRWSLVSNLPYNVGTTIVLDVLERAPAVHSMLVMVQREVAERLVAGPGSRACGIPSVKLAWWADARIVGTVAPTVFVPRPRVESALVEISRHARAPGDVDLRLFHQLVEAGFGQRRKMLRRSLGNLIDDTVFASAGVDPTRRPEHLGLDDWIGLARAVGDRG